MEAGGYMGQGKDRGAKFPTRTCEGYDANDGVRAGAWVLKFIVVYV